MGAGAAGATFGSSLRGVGSDGAAGSGRGSVLITFVSGVSLRAASFSTLMASGDGFLGLCCHAALGASSSSGSPAVPRGSSSSAACRRRDRRGEGATDAGAVRSTISRSDTLGGASVSWALLADAFVDARCRAASKARARVDLGVCARVGDGAGDGDARERVWYGLTTSGTGGV